MDLRADRARIARIADNDDDPAPIPDDVAGVLQTLAANGVTLTPCGDIKDNRPCSWTLSSTPNQATRSATGPAGCGVLPDCRTRILAAA